MFSCLRSRLGRILLQPSPPFRSFSRPSAPCYRQSSWEPWEDEALVNFIKHNGPKWTEFSRHCLPHRSVNACYLRWTEHLDPSIRKGPLSKHEIELLYKGVQTYGEGNWRMIRDHMLPERTAARLSNTWNALASPQPTTTTTTVPSSTLQKKRFTEEEDRLLLEGYAQFGPKWRKIQQRYLPHRSPPSLATRYNDKLSDDVGSSDKKRLRWTEEEHDLLLRRTILYGHNWSKVAEGIPGRSAVTCRRKWIQLLDPSIKSKGNRQWSEEETCILWRRLYAHGGHWNKVVEALPGRNVDMCLYKMRKDLRRLRHVFGDQVDIRKDENRLEWRARIAGLMCEWIDKDQQLALDASGSLVLRREKWTTKEINLLKGATMTTTTPPATEEEWQRVADAVGKPINECKERFDKLQKRKKRRRVLWTQQEDDKLKELVDKYGECWERIAEELPGRSANSCWLHWYRQQQKGPRWKQGRFSKEESALLEEGVSMFGTNWVAIAKTYLPERTPTQCARHWHGSSSSSSTDTQSGPWSFEEDAALKFAIDQHLVQEDDNDTQWEHIARLVPGRSITQCRDRWFKVLQPGIKKGRWTTEEQMQLMDIVEHVKEHKEDGSATVDWKTVAKELDNGRTAWSCALKYDQMIRSGNQFGLR
ncbi:hypothetical protein O0I10_000946 [Lichtheimia ornata]|uniref:Homeodomain-like protein n=1 Tax=Lichtheimia ornata TaxID=688661 RepID=A0AAD7Y4L0_9FUNG|nr:uncharacterized protein O0I10_000946 [Lichtheimia ornata]KAJ8663697.1 hypothetical protein O0I10_000946 [Lichtheimia ornata]